MTRERTVLISGASIAGPALAYWLDRRGFDVTVVEVGPSIRPGGQAVDIRGAAREVVARMGILPAIRESTVDERGIRFVDERGRRLAEMPVDAFGGEGIVADIEIMRGDLTRILHATTLPGVEYRFGDRITALDADPVGVDVTFGSGDHRRFDAVIGADGVHSGVRGLAFGPETDYVRHLGAYTSYFTVPEPGDLDGWFEMANLSGGLVTGIRPERGGTAKASLGFRSEPVHYDRRDPAAARRLLADAFAGRRGGRVPALLSALDTAPDFYFDAICQVHVGQWWRGRVALAGDAAHCGSPLSGLGTATALVGAYVLAGELAVAPDDPPAAFARYQDRLRGYVTQAQKLPPGGVRGFAPRSRAVIRLRGVSMRAMTRWPMRAVLAGQFAKADAIELPDYPATDSGPVTGRPATSPYDDRPATR